MQILSLIFCCYYVSIAMRHKLITTDFKGVFLPLGKNARSCFHIPWNLSKTCVAAIGVVRFSVRSFGCALFYCLEINMQNKYLRYLLKNEPKKVISKYGFKIRKLISYPVRNIVGPATSKNTYHIDQNDSLPTDRPLIFACTHQCKDDIALALASAGRHTYLLFASLPDFYGTLDGPALWINGVILIDRKNKSSRKAAIPKMKYAIELGADILMYPEGTLNKTENLIVQKLFPGIYNLAKETNALVVPMAVIQEGKDVYSKVCDPFDIIEFEKQDGLDKLRDLMATAKYELMEKHSQISRAEISDAAAYWENKIQELVNSMLPFYDFEIENTSQYIDKSETTNEQAYEHLKRLTPTLNNAFLFNKRNHN